MRRKGDTKCVRAQADAAARAEGERRQREHMAKRRTRLEAGFAEVWRHGGTLCLQPLLLWSEPVMPRCQGGMRGFQVYRFQGFLSITCLQHLDTTALQPCTFGFAQPGS